jgi:hypothetical protein
MYRTNARAIALPSPRATLRPQLRCALLLLACAAPIVLLHVVRAGLGLLLVPALMHATAWLLLALPATLLVLAYQLRVRAWPTIRTRSTAFKVAYLGGSVLAHLVLTCALGWGLVVTDPDFLSAPTFYASAPSPDGTRVAYLVSDGFFCNATVYYRARFSPVLHRGESAPADCDPLPRAHLEWSPDSSAAVPRMPDGAPIPHHEFRPLFGC